MRPSLHLVAHSFDIFINALEYRGNYSATSNNTTLAVDGWAVAFGTWWSDWAGPQPTQALPAVPNVTAHPSTASVPVTVLLYSGPLLCGLNVSLKG